MNDGKTLSVRAKNARAALRRFLSLAVAGMVTYWSACAQQRRCLDAA